MRFWKSKNLSKLLTLVLLLSQLLGPGVMGSDKAFAESGSEPRVVRDDSAATAEDSPVIIPVLLNDKGNISSIVLVSTPANGTATINPDQTITYTPDKNFFGTDTFEYSAAGKSYTSTATVTITVSEVNDAPVAVDDFETASEDTPMDIPVLANDSDADRDALTVISVTQPAHGTVSINLNGTVRYVPNANFFGQDTFNYTVSDSQGATSGGTVTISVSMANDPPAASGDLATVAEDSSVIIDVLANDGDVDGDVLVLTGVTQPSHGTATANPDGTVIYTPGENYHGSDKFSYTVSDGNGGTSTAMVFTDVTPVNDAPFAVDDAVSTDEDEAVIISVLANDSDIDGDVLQIDGVSQPSYGTTDINPDGTVTYLPQANFSGHDTFSYVLSDGKGGTARGSVSVDVTPINDLPQAADDTALLNEDTSVIVAALANDTDIDGDVLSVVYASQPANGSVQLNPDGTITYLPNPDFSGNDTFRYTVADGHGGTAEATVIIIVDSVNDLPVAVDDSVYLQEDSTALIMVLTNDSDVDQDPLTVTSVSDPANGTAAANPDGSITYEPRPDFNGSDLFTYSVSDGNGGTAEATVHVTVAPVNDSPTATDDHITVDEDDHITVAVLANDTDIDGDAITVTAVDKPAKGTATLNPDGTLTYTPLSNYNGSDSLTYTISDSSGSTAVATVTITVKAVNDAPQAVDDSGYVDEDGSVTLNVLANDTDIDQDPISIISVVKPSFGKAVKNSDGTITYVPDANFNGVDSFSYTISDGAGWTAGATVSLTVYAVNDIPQALDDEASLAEDSSVVIPVLANDSDVDGDQISIISISWPTHGTVRQDVYGNLTYTPNPGFNGTDAFEYTVSDGNGGTATATVSLTISPVNDIPAAVNDLITVDENNSLTFEVLSNDSDPDGDQLTITSVTAAGYGTAVLNPDGTITYTPNSYFNGTDTFSYWISDGNGGTAVADVIVTVVSVNDNPVAVNDAATVKDAANVIIDVMANDSDPDGDPLTIAQVTTAVYGTVTKNWDNTVTYAPNPGFCGNDSFSYTVSDGHGGSSTATVTVTVVDSIPPELIVSAPVNDTDATSSQISVVGTTEPGVTLTVSNIPTAVSESGSFAATVNLVSGINTINVVAADAAGNKTTATRTVYYLPDNKVTNFSLSQNPIKIGTTTSLQYNLGVNAYVSVNIYNESGDLVRTLLNKTLKNAGSQYASWDGRDKSGIYVPDGYYKLIVEANDATGTLVGRSKITALAANAPKVTTASDTPDPFDPLTGEQSAINYTISSDAIVSVSILNSYSSLVRNLTTTNEVKPAGTYTIYWDGKDNTGNLAPDAVYYYQIVTTSPTVSAFNNTYKSTTTVEKEAPQVTGLGVTYNTFKLAKTSQNIMFNLSEKAYVTIKILNGSNLVRTIMNNALKNPGYISTAWDGKDESGIYVPEGNYTVEVTAIDTFNKASAANTVTFAAGYQPDVTNVTVPNPFNPSEGAATISYNIAYEGLVTVQILNAYSSTVRNLENQTLQPAGTHTVIWDGNDDDGRSLPDANYTVQINAVSPTVADFYATVKTPITVEQNNPEITSLTFNPNPLKISAQSLTISYNLSEKSTVDVTIFRGTELVRNLVTGQQKNAGYVSHTWDGKDNSASYVAEGDYTIVVKTVDAFGKVSTVSGTVTAGCQPTVSNATHSNEPFDPSFGPVTISFDTSTSANINVTMMKGPSAVRTIAAGILPAGSNSVVWDGTDTNGNLVGDGSYTYLIEAASPTVDSFRNSAKGTITVEANSPVISNMGVSPYIVKIGSSAVFGYNVSEPVTLEAQVLRASDRSVIRDLPLQTKSTDGYYTISWDTQDNFGNLITTGDYILEITATDNFNKSSTTEMTFQAAKAPVIANASALPPVINATGGEQTVISYTIDEQSFTTLRIYDSAGQIYKTVYFYKETAAGTDSVSWDGTNDAGQAVNGLFTFKIEASSVIGSFKAVPVFGTIEVTGVPVS